ncbi:hypothetical protein HHK36_007849 [Tetracentron sinense]|uniref:Tudor domain-containing protein n=1 Tax=Tetracentron sinense TaxID=13715 RepID=A0A834ZLB3_TETSI|nr:hypothetical protein HHK36_007849 [Tetracentron sinense]
MEENVGCSMNSYAGDYEMAPNEVITDINTSEILEGCMIENEIVAEPSTMEQNNEHFIVDNVTFEDEIVEQCKVIGSVKNYIPKVGMEFETEKEAHAFYNYYAMKEGFGIKIKSSHVRKSTQELCHVLFACCKEGFTNRIAITQYSRPDTRTGCKARLRVKLTDYKKWRVTEVNIEHNHQVTPRKARFYKSHKHLDAGSKRRLELNNEAGIRFNKSYHSLVVDAGGYEKLSFGEKECRNHIDRKWVPVYLKDTFYAGMSTTQRSESMNAFFDKYVNSQTYLKEFVDKYEMALKDKFLKCHSGKELGENLVGSKNKVWWPKDQMFHEGLYIDVEEEVLTLGKERWEFIGATEMPHSGKELGKNLVGSKIKVWWPNDQMFYEGVIVSFDLVLYMDGEEEVLTLRKEQWEFVGDDTLLDGASKMPHSGKELCENLVGSKIKVWWPKDQMFYEGVIVSFDPVKKKHKVLYIDSEEDVMTLRKERWEFVGDDTLPDGASKMPHSGKELAEILVGSKIKVWWPNDQMFYEGVIVPFDLVLYMDSEEEVLTHRKEQWEVVGDDTLLDGASKMPHSGNELWENLVDSKIKFDLVVSDSTRFYEGVIVSFDLVKKKHKVLYIVGEEDLMTLRKEKWEFVGDDTLPDGASETPPNVKEVGENLVGSNIKASKMPHCGKELAENMVSSKIKVCWPNDQMFYDGVIVYFDPVKKKHKVLYMDGEEEGSKMPHSGKELCENLVGSKIKVWWRKDQMFYKGVIVSFDPVKKKHKVLYIDGEEDVMTLRKERWEFIGDDTLPDGASKMPHSGQELAENLVGSKIKVLYLDGEEEVLILRKEQWEFVGDDTLLDGASKMRHSGKELCENLVGSKIKVLYMDGEEEVLTLRKEQWEFIGEDTLLDGASKMPHSGKELGENLVGLEIKVWWPKDQMFYEGVIVSFDPVKKKHKVLYIDGEEDVMTLRKERWEFVGNDTLPDGASKTPHSGKELAENLVGSKIKVWWPNDQMYLLFMFYFF